MKLNKLVPFLLLIGDLKHDSPSYILEKYELMANSDRPYKYLDATNLRKLLSWIEKWNCPEFTKKGITEIQQEFLGKLTLISFMNNGDEKDETSD